MFHFRLTPDHGEPLELESDSRDVANWERTHHGATMGQLGADEGRNLSFVALYSIAFFAAKRQGLIGSASAAEFERTYALELIDDDAEKSEDEIEGGEEGDDTGEEAPPQSE
jgi:hypothetical protein